MNTELIGAELPNEKKQSVSWGKISIIMLCKIIISIVAFILALDCNRNMDITLRIFTTIIATIFSEIYVLYYSFYHIFMGAKCY